MKRLLVGFATLVLVLGGSLAQQQILRVKADVQVLLVSDTALPFGTVFPGEELAKTYTVQLDTSATSSTYITVLTPPSNDEQDPLFGRKDLCPYLNLKNIDTPAESDVPEESTLARPSDTLDSWQIKLTVPAIEGHVAQDHTGGIVVTGGDFGCKISITTDTARQISGMKYNDVDFNGEQGDGEQGLAGWKIYAGKFIQELNVDAQGAISTTTPLENGKEYFMRVSGTYDAADSITADAKYSVRAPNTAWTDSVQNYESYGPTLLDLQIDGSSPDWGSADLNNPSHVYWHTVAGTGAPLSLQIYDIASSNNTGALNVKLYEVVAESLTDSSGNYTLDLAGYSGEATIAEQTQTGWVQTMPVPDGFYTVATSTSAFGRDFGNHLLDQGGCEGEDCSSGDQADLSVVKTVDKASINSIDPIVYSFTVHNLGPDVAHNVVMTDVVPAIITVVSSTSTLGTYSTSTGEWLIGTLNVGSSTILTINGTVGSVTPGQVVVNNASVKGLEADPNLSNNTSSATSAAPGGGGCTSNCGGGGGGGGGSSGATISGQKFNDFNLDGKKDSGEPGLPGWIMYLDSNNNKQLDTGETYTFTDAQGNYSFSFVTSGIVHVREVQQSDWMQTLPGFAQDYEYALNVVVNGSYPNTDFGNSQAQVAGSSTIFGPQPQVAGANTGLPKTGLPAMVWLYLALASLLGGMFLAQKRET